MAIPRIITFGEVMARLATPGHQRFQQAMPGSLDIAFAGAEVNVAVAVAQLGGSAAFITALPEHEVADAVMTNLRGLGVDTRFVVRTPVGRLGLFFLEHGVNQRPAQVIYDREGSSVSLLTAEAYAWDDAFAGADWFHVSGVTPAISARAAEVAEYAMRRAKACGVKVSFDMNFRRRLWQWEPGTTPHELAARTVRDLLAHADLFIGGPEDIGLLTGEPLRNDDTRYAAQQLTARFPHLSHVAMTQREAASASHHRLGGVLYVSAGGGAHLAPQRGEHYVPYDMPGIVDRPGGGDAFAAGLLLALATAEWSAPSAAIAFATAASCLAHSIPGDFALLRRSEVETLMHGGDGGRIIR
jgi:2-dehydro-3-deoxygluconokinase